VRYLNEELNWPIDTKDFEEITFDYTPEELGIDPDNAAKIQEIKQLRPFYADQPWGIFFIKFEPKRLPVVVLRRILGSLATKQRASANSIDRAHWSSDDLLFISNYGEDDVRQISFAHFSQPENKDSLPTLKVLGWNYLDTLLHLDEVAEQLTNKLKWPAPNSNAETWRKNWSSAFTLRNREVITTSRDLSIQLARLARSIRDSIKTAIYVEAENGPLKKLMKAFKESLLHDITAEEFADMYAQTIAYGLLSARIANPKSTQTSGFTFCTNTNPFVKELMESFLRFENKHSISDASKINFDELGVHEVIELLDQANMEAVIRDFGDKNPQEDPVIHFYELFLEEYDASQKVKRGVFYTPFPVVSYIVRSVHELLKTEFGLEDGLADITTWEEMSQKHKDLKIPQGVSSEQPFVQILDPATGTGTFLVEVIEIVYRTMKEKWEKEAGGPLLSDITERWNDYVPKYLLPRLHGYEILMAPYVIAHLKIGLKLYETGYRFDNEERLRVYLTNALEPPTDIGQTLMKGTFPALAHEAHAVNNIKREKRFTIIIGNPPYSKISYNMSDWSQKFVKNSFIENLNLPSYYEVSGSQLGERKVNLQDDYIKFIRLGQYHAAKSKVMILGLITNRGFLDGPTFRGMRQSLISTFSSIFVVDLHGDSNIGESVPEGFNNDNVFDIQQGVSISLMLLSPFSGSKKTFFLSNVWGTRNEKFDRLKNPVCISENRLPFDPKDPYYFYSIQDFSVGSEYFSWPKINEIFPDSVSGIVTSRDNLVIANTDQEIIDRIDIFLDPSLTDDNVKQTLKLNENYAWNVSEARCQLRDDPNWRENFENILYRPFDVRRILYHKSIVWRTREPLMQSMRIEGNLGLIATRQSLDKFSHVFVSKNIVEYKAGSHHRNCQVFPMFIYANKDNSFSAELRNANLSKKTLFRFFSSLRFDKKQINTSLQNNFLRSIFYYVYCILHSPTFRKRYASQLKIDFPRIPLPGNIEMFDKLVSLGETLTSLHLLDSTEIGHFITTYQGNKNPRILRVGWSNETVWLDANEVCARDAHLAKRGGTIGFVGVPKEVWNFLIGGYQVCYKWLKDRKGRTLSDEDIIHYQKIIVAIKETIRIMNEIDVVIEQYGGWPDAFQVK